MTTAKDDPTTTTVSGIQYRQLPRLGPQMNVDAAAITDSAPMRRVTGTDEVIPHSSGAAIIRLVTATWSPATRMSTNTYNMQGSQLMATLNDGASAGDHERDVRNFAHELAVLKTNLTTAADRSAYAAIEKDFGAWKVLDSRAMAFAKAHHKDKATAL